MRPKEKFLGADHTLALFESLESAPDSERRRIRDQIISQNQGLVRHLARKFFVRAELADMDQDDAMQEGNLGLLEAIDKFDHRRGTKFSDYAHHWIKVHIQRAIEKQPARGARVPTHTQEIMTKVDRAKWSIAAQRGHQPTAEQIFQKLGPYRLESSGDTVLTLEHVRQALEVMERRAVPFDANDELDSQRRSAPAKIVAFPSASPDSQLDVYSETQDKRQEQALIVDEVEMLVAALPDERDRDVLTHRLGLLGEEIQLLKEVGYRWGVTPEWVRQLEIKGLKLIKASLGYSKAEILEAIRQRDDLDELLADFHPQGAKCPAK